MITTQKWIGMIEKPRDCSGLATGNQARANQRVVINATNQLLCYTGIFSVQYYHSIAMSLYHKHNVSVVNNKYQYEDSKADVHTCTQQNIVDESL